VNIKSILGLDPQAVLMTMLGLVGLYLIVSRPGAVTQIAGGILRPLNEGFIILQGRSGRGGLPQGY
jgi:hydrogenase-4 membrane subunit HyfE